jgi:hypothetical protein
MAAWMEGRLTLTMKKSTDGSRPPMTRTMNASQRPAGDRGMAVDVADAERGVSWTAAAPE